MPGNIRSNQCTNCVECRYSHSRPAVMEKDWDCDCLYGISVPRYIGSYYDQEEFVPAPEDCPLGYKKVEHCVYCGSTNLEVGTDFQCKNCLQIFGVK